LRIPAAAPPSLPTGAPPVKPPADGPPPLSSTPAAKSPAAKTGPAEPSVSPQEILAAFTGRIEPVRTSATYKLGIFLAAAVMIVLPLIYVGFIVLAAYLVYWHMVHDTAILSAGGGRRGAVWAFIIYVAPIFIGGILVLFMIKPLFARPAQRGRIRSLTKRSDPLLFAFVERICAVVGAPQPQRIDVDAQVNASASFRRGVFSMFGNDLVLTIGIPLVAGLNLRQFAGVLAHEFGHFTQGAGMRLTFLVRSISHWFTRVVYERDEWDEKLAAWAAETDIRIGIILHIARLFVWLTRKILWVLMMIGHIVAGFMLRQMEFDADRHEVRMAGSDTFESTARRLVMLNVASQGAHADLSHFYKEGRLADNLPRLIVANIAHIPEKAKQQIEKMVDETQTGLFDTHPADKDRIAAAHREPTEGVFRLECPASAVFGHFAAVSRNVTEDVYRGVFGSRFQASQMHPIDDLLDRQDKEIEAGKALERFYQGEFRALRPVRLPDLSLTTEESPQQVARQMKQAREQMLEAKPAYAQAYAAFEEADAQTIKADQARAMLMASFKIPQKVFGFRANYTADTAKVRRQAIEQQQKLAPVMARFEKAAAARIGAAMQLLQVGEVAAKVDVDGQHRAQCKRLLPVLGLLNRQHDALLALRNDQAAMGVLLGSIEGNQQNESLFKTIHSQMAHLSGKVRGLYQALAREPYPFDHAKGQISVNHYALESLPIDDDLGAIYDAADCLLDKVPTLYSRVVCQLAEIAEQVETAFGLPPLPEPVEEKG